MQKGLERPLIDTTIIIVTLIGAGIVSLLYVFQPRFVDWALFTGLPVYAGFLLPRLFNRKAMLARAENKQRLEKERWGFSSRDREGPWLNYIDRPLLLCDRIAEGRRFYSQWLIVHDGMIIVNPGISTPDLKQRKVVYEYDKNRTYAWDGCTPKAWFYWLALMGTPDWWIKPHELYTLDNGKVCKKTVLWQMAHPASLVHDAFYQYLDTVPVSKREVDELFYRMLQDAGMIKPVAFIYLLAVKFLGARGVKAGDPNRDPGFEPPELPAETELLCEENT